MNIIKFELENIREKVQHAFLMRNEEISAMVAKSLEKYCTEEWLQNVIDEQVRELLANAAKTRVDGSYKASELISDIIHKTLIDKLTKIKENK